MAGGTFESQNKVRAGVYIRFKSGRNNGLTLGERGTVAICEALDWGPVGQVLTVEAGADTTPFTGYDIANSKNRFLAELFKGTNRTSGAKTVLLYRPAASSQASAAATAGNLTATAKYPGVRGNDITIIVAAIVGESTFKVQTVVAGTIVDEQVAATVADLVANDWVTFSGTGALTATTGVALTGGVNGTVQTTAYSTFLTAIEAYKFDVLCYDGSESTVITAFANFIKRICDDNGQYAQLVVANATSPDSRYIINVASGVTLEDGTTLTAQQVTWWASGALAGAKYNESLTYAKYPGAVAATAMTNAQFIDAINSGKFVLNSDDGSVKVESDINSLVTFTTDISKIYRKNRVMRLCNTIANDIYKQFSESFIGIVNNNEVGRSRFKTVIVGYLLDLQANEGIQNFTPDDVEVLAGVEIDAVVINIALFAVDSTEKIYMTIEVS